MRLLIIEDDAEAAGYLAKGLRESGHAVDLAATGREGLLMAAAEAYDVLIVRGRMAAASRAMRPSRRAAPPARGFSPAAIHP